MVPTAYRFAPLRRDEVRLLQLQRAERPTDPLKGAMETQQLGTKTDTLSGSRRPYVTLSYAWGQSYADGSHLTHSISCDGRDIRITSSLDRGLRRIRAIKPSWWVGLDGYSDEASFSRQPPLLWVDQVCIDQQDLGERNREVSRMGDIYKNSSCLIIWLDEIDDAGGALIRKAVTMDLPGEEAQSLWELQWRNSLDYFDWERGWGYDMDQTTRWTAMASLMERPFFRRRWCVQECVNTLRANQFMLIGGTILPLPDIRKTGKLMSIPDSDRGEAIFASDKHTVRFLLQEFDVAECTLEHDRIYALLPVAKDTSEYDIRIDYSQPFEEICRDVVKGAMNPRSGGHGHLFQLLVLTASRRADPSSSPTGLLTWTPDWRVPRSYTCDEHMAITRSFAYPDYHVSSDYLQVHGDYVYLRGELIQPCFPPCQVNTSAEISSRCRCCILWSDQYSQWTSDLRAVLSNATARNLFLFTPSFQHRPEYQPVFGEDRITFLLSMAPASGAGSKRQAFRLESSFNGSSQSNHLCDEDATWICLS